MPTRGTHEGTAVCDLKKGSASLTVQVTLGGTEADRAAPSNVWRLTAMPSKTPKPETTTPRIRKPETENSENPNAPAEPKFRNSET